MICGSILLSAFVLVVEYSSIYTAQLAVPSYKVLVKSIEDVAANPAINLYLSKGSPLESYILVCIYLINYGNNGYSHYNKRLSKKYPQESTKGALKIVGDQIRNNPKHSLSHENFPKDVSVLVKNENVFIIVSLKLKQLFRKILHMIL